MLLRDLKPETTLTIVSENKTDRLEFQTKILAVKGNKVILKPVIDNGLLVNFTSNAVETKLIYSKGDIDYQFNNVFLINMRIHGNLFCHEVAGDVESELINKRSAPRYVINKQCVFTPGAHRLAELAFIRDVSQTGVSVISDLEASINDIVTVSFEPKSGLGRVEIKAKIKRITTDPETSKHLYGCQLINENRLLNRYVMDIQRSRLKVNGRRKCAM